LVSAGVAALGILLASRLPNVVPTDVPQKGALLHRAAFFPAVVLASVSLASGGLHAFVPLYVIETQAGDSRWFFALYAAVIVVLRTFVGRIADRYGPSFIVVPGVFCCGIASFVLVAGSDRSLLITSAIFFGLGWGAMFPGLYSLIMNRVRTGERGSATGSFTAAFDLAFAGGQILLGVVLEATSFGTVFIIGGISAFLGGVFYIFGKARSDLKFPELSHPR
jgi:MFS family permease